MKINKVFELIDKNISEADFVGPISSKNILKAEKILENNFPKSYFLFLEKYGAGDILGIEIFGIINNPEIDGNMIPNGIWLTQNLREERNLPNSYIVVSETGDGSYFIIDTSIINDDLESPVYILYINNLKEKIADNFGEFLLEELENLLEE